MALKKKKKDSQNHCFYNYKLMIPKLVFIYTQTLYAVEKVLKLVPDERAIPVEVLNYF